MSTIDMWKGTLVFKVTLIIGGFTLFSANNTLVFVVGGLVLLLVNCLLIFRQGQGMGHVSCGVLKSIERTQGNVGVSGVDEKTRRTAWSVQAGIKGIFAGAIVPYLASCVYIICTLCNASDMVQFVSRVVAWIFSIPYWPFIAMWHENFVDLTFDVILVLMVGPFILPVFQFLGYLQGPKFWEKTEQAMADGKRRAKARSRIVKKNKDNRPRWERPEI